MPFPEAVEEHSLFAASHFAHSHITCSHGFSSNVKERTHCTVLSFTLLENPWEHVICECASCEAREQWVVRAPVRDRTVAVAIHWAADSTWNCFSLQFFISRISTTMFLYGARLFISIADMCGYVYTPEVYPTSMRGIGLGACSGAARIGCMITPFVAMVSRTIR